MKASARRLVGVTTVVLISFAAYAGIIFGLSCLRSDDYSFTQLLGFINQGESRSSVRWTYIRYHASSMRLTAEDPDVWSVSGLCHDKPAQLVIRFTGGKVERVSLDLLPPDQGAAVPAEQPNGSDKLSL